MAVDDSWGVAGGMARAFVVGSSFDGGEKLSNGDLVTLRWDIDEETVGDYEAVYGARLSFGDVESTVEGLEEVGAFDAFQGMEVSFDGVAPAGTASLGGMKPAGVWQEMEYVLDKAEGLSNGDTVTVTAKFDEALIEKYGAVPETTEKTYTVEGLVSYVTKLDQVTDESLELMKQQGEGALMSYFAGKDGFTLTGMEYLGEYLLTAKSNDMNVKNKIFLVFRAAVDYSYRFWSHDYAGSFLDYWYISFENLMVDTDGSSVADLTDYDTAPKGMSLSDGKTTQLNGYLSLQELYGNAITTNIEKYKHEDNAEEVEAAVNTEYWDSTGKHYIGEDGKYVTGWQWISDGSNTYCYYFDEDGNLLTDTETPDGCTVDSEGRWVEDGKVQTQ